MTDPHSHALDGQYSPTLKLSQSRYSFRPGDGDTAEHAARWLIHAQATPSTTTPAQRRTHARNELIVLGRVY